jgi:hypothetical protein
VNADTEVYTTDGLVGTVVRVLTEGTTDKVTHVVVMRGALTTRDVSVPIEYVAGLDPEAVRLRISTAELDRLPTFVP